MIRSRRSVLPLALLALAACKKSDAPSPTVGSGSGSAVAAASDAALPPLTANPTPAPGGAITKPFFYKVEKGGKVSHLLGTWHYGVDAEKQLPKVVWEKLAAAKAFAMEADPADPAALSAFKRTDGKTLEQELGPEYWAKLEALLDESEKQMVQVMKVSSAIALLQFKNLPQTVPMELALAAKARDVKAKMVFLEQAAHQLKLIEKWLDARMLKALLDDPTTSKTQIQAALASYIEGDDAELATMAMDRDSMKKAGLTDAEIEQGMKDLLYDRNAAWIPTLEELFGQGDAFVAVGAGHLVGQKSVIELLTAKGYTVTRVAP